MKIYINIAKMFGGPKIEWVPCWHSQWAAADNRAEAVRLRRHWLGYLQTFGSDKWRKHHLRTVKVELP